MLRERERGGQPTGADTNGTPGNWGEAVSSGEWSWPNLQQAKSVGFTAKAGRYVYFQRLTAWGWGTYANANGIWVYQPGGGVSTTPMVASQTFDPGAVLRNNFAGWVGLRYSTTYYFAAYADLSYGPVNLKYAGSGTATYSWVPTSETRYLYDGMLVIQERDTNNIPTVSYTRGVDLSGSRQGAGGIGGLLARSEHATHSPYNLTRHDSYHADGNGNITAMVYGGSELSASYQYDPDGRMMATGGTRPTANLYRFSSRMVHTNSGLYYYGYRFYDPNLQRWLNRDPIGEQGHELLKNSTTPDFVFQREHDELNPYTFCVNDPISVGEPEGESSVSYGLCVTACFLGLSSSDDPRHLYWAWKDPSQLPRHIRRQFERDARKALTGSRQKPTQEAIEMLTKERAEGQLKKLLATKVGAKVAKNLAPNAIPGLGQLTSLVLNAADAAKLCWCGYKCATGRFY